MLDKESYDAADVPQLNLEDKGNGDVAASGYRPGWVNLGSFEALYPLKDKTCKSAEKLSFDEINLIRGFVVKNLKKPEESEIS